MRKGQDRSAYQKKRAKKKIRTNQFGIKLSPKAMGYTPVVEYAKKVEKLHRKLRTSKGSQAKLREQREKARQNQVFLQDQKTGELTHIGTVDPTQIQIDS